MLVTVLLLLRDLNRLGFKNSKLEKILQDKGELLVKEGMLQVPALARTKISRQQLYAQLRGKHILHLGKVKRMYIEACGLFSIYEEKEPKPGQPVLPPIDTKIIDYLHVTRQQVCTNCGWVQEPNATKGMCKNCGCNNWTAVS